MEFPVKRIVTRKFEEITHKKVLGKWFEFSSS